MTRKPKSLRWQLFSMMAIIAIVEAVVLILSVILSGVFTELDAEAFRFFSSDSAERAVSLDGNTGRLIRNMTNAVTSLSSDIQALADDAGVPLSDAYLDEDLYGLIAEQFGEQLVEFLNGNSVTAAFCILNGSNISSGGPDAHAAVFIRDSAPRSADPEHKNLQLEVGPLEVARSSTMAVANSWAPYIVVGENAEYYMNPIEACLEYPRSELVRYGYWSPPTVIIPGSQEAISYTLPITDASGIPCGVMGFEISLSFFTSDYFSNTNLPYQGSFFAITSGTENELDTSWIIPGSPTAAAYLQPGEGFAIQPVNGTDVFETDIADVGGVYCTVNELTMYSKNSPFADQRWLLIGMVEQSVLNETSSSISTTLLVTMAITLGVAFVAIFLLTFLSTRKIAGLSRYVNDLAPGSEIRFEKTELKEIDDLTSAVERLNQRLNDSMKVTSKMMELTQLPLGGFEVSNDMDTVMLTEYIYRLLQLDEGEQISKEDWSSLFAELTANPADGYPDIYSYDAHRMSALLRGNGLLKNDPEPSFDTEDLYKYKHTTRPEDRWKWLRIIEAPTENGTVGMILDATADVDQLMHLAHELDYDGLTHLYNRNAFKREAFKKINAQPDKVGAVIFADLDNLKPINDTYGHQTGDKLITTAADMFRECMEYGGIAARISGDEFAMFLYGYESQEEVRRIIQKLYSGFRKRSFVTPDGKTQWISCSSGIAWYPDDSCDVADLLKISDYAMYEAKHDRKGAIAENSGKYLDIEDESEFEGSEAKNLDNLRRMIDERRFTFNYQPVVDLHSGMIFGFEALMCPQSDIYKTPTEVLSAARAYSLLGPLESALVVKTLQTTQDLLDEIGDRKIFVNSITGQRLNQREWDTIRKRNGAILPHIIVEVTEAENDDLDSMLIKLRQLRAMGIPLAVSDFGQGFSNEVRIIAMQPAMIKIGAALIHHLDSDLEHQNTVRDLVSFAHTQGVKVAAESVESEAELKSVIRYGFDYAQGFLLGRPAAEFKPLAESVHEMLIDLMDEQEDTRGS